MEPEECCRHSFDAHLDSRALHTIHSIATHVAIVMSCGLGVKAFQATFHSTGRGGGMRKQELGVLGRVLGVLNYWSSPRFYLAWRLVLFLSLPPQLSAQTPSTISG